MHLSVQPSNPSASFQNIATDLLPVIANYLTIKDMNSITQITKVFANALLGGHEKFLKSCLAEKQLFLFFVCSPYSAVPFISRTLISRNSLANPLTREEYTIWNSHISHFISNPRHHEDVSIDHWIRFDTMNHIYKYFYSKIAHPELSSFNT